MAPPDFRAEQHDDATGKTVGWEPIDDSPFRGPFRAALGAGVDRPVGTYELIGPKINGNPEGVADHRLVPHAAAERLDPRAPSDHSWRGCSTATARSRVWSGTTPTVAGPRSRA